MASFKYYHVTRKVRLGGNVSLMDESIQGGCDLVEAREAHKNTHPKIDVTFDIRETSKDELEEYFNEL